MTGRHLADAPARASRAQEIFETVLELDPENRAELLDQTCTGDPYLRADVEELLRSLGRARTEELFPPLDLRPLVGSAVRIEELCETHLGRLQPGQSMGRHVVLELVGAGGAAIVYAAHDTVLERKIALKVLSAARGDPAAVSRLVAEATAMARVNHPNVVTVHDVGVVEGVPFVAMEYVTGVTLGEWRRQRSRSSREVMTAMAGVARGLEAAHRAQIIHRDVKPDNILVDGERVLVTDFGLSVRDGGASAELVAGTPGYMAREQYRGEPATPATDVFGFCVTLYEMLYLIRPFGSGSFAEIQRRVTAGDVGKPTRRVAVPRRVRRLMLRGLAPDPAARPADMRTIAVVLLSGPASWIRRAARAFLAAVLILASFWVGSRRDARAPERPQVVSGPAWVQPPEPVPAAFFGVTLQSATGVMPSFRVGAVRFWDGRTRWANLEPARGRFDWTVLDRMVAGTKRAGLPILFTIGGTPAWAAPDGPRGPYNDGSRAAEPDHLSDWETFLTALTERYRNDIEAYETWVLADDPHFYTGRVETLVEMTRIAWRIVKTKAPRALLVCPGMGRLWSAEGRRFLRRFAELGGYQHCDVANIKLYARRAVDPPETMLELVATADQLLHEAGVHPPVWNTGTRYEIPLAGSLDETTAVNHAARFFLVGLYGRLDRMYFYNWGGTKIPIVLQPESGLPTAAARAVERLEGWLVHSSLRSCGHGGPVGLPENVWECRLTMTEDGRTLDAAIRWTHEGTAATNPGSRPAVVHRLDGSRVTWPPGQQIPATEQPMLLVWK